MKLFQSLLLLLCASASSSAQNLPLPPLKYEYNALEPYIDEQTMRIHHLGHQGSCLGTLNTILADLRQYEQTKYLAKMGVDRLLTHLDEVPEEFRLKLARSAGCFVNHELFFDGMAPAKESSLRDGQLLDAIKRSFGSLEEFKIQFTNAALSLFGSGWLWLLFDQKSGLLAVAETKEQESPLVQENSAPLLVIDLWEHAYYLNYQSRRAEYVNAWWNVVNWDEVERRLRLTRGGTHRSEL